MISGKPLQPPDPLIAQADIQSLVHSCSQVILSSDLRAYLHDIIVFLRTHRALALSPPALPTSSSHGKHQNKINPNDTLPGPGASALATRHFHLLVRALCALHGLDFVTPSLVSLAARKVYPHRLRISAAERDRGLMYGGDLRGTKEWYKGYDSVDDVIEEVLEMVEAPL
jgi:MoxR-like ATPase